MPVGTEARPGKRALYLFISAAAILFAAWWPAHASAATFNSVADAYADSANPGSNYGSRTTFKHDNSPVINAYVRFNVQGVGSFGSAQLRIFATSNNSSGVEIHSVTGAGANTWSEAALTYSSAPTLGPVVASSGPLSAGNWYSFDVSSHVTANGLVTFGITGPGNTSTSYSSREGSNPPQLLVPAPVASANNGYTIAGSGGSYTATPTGGGSGYSGSLKSVVENAARALSNAAGGTITFGSGLYDLGNSWFELKSIRNVTFQGQGMYATTIQNNSGLAADTEPFNTGDTRNLVIRDMTVNAGGPTRTTSDALDFDNGNNNLLERVRVAQARGRGIVFDGKDVTGGQPRAASGNTVRDCVISGTATHGIQFLAATNNRVEGCTITNVGGNGIQATKSSTIADQPNKKASGNVITGNTITNAGQDGISINSSDRTQILNNTILNSANVSSSRDGIRITSSNSISCDDNRVSGNRAGDNQSPKTQRYGLNIRSSLCHGTVVGPGNDFSGNLSGPISNSGTGTIFL